MFNHGKILLTNVPSIKHVLVPPEYQLNNRLILSPKPLFLWLVIGHFSVKCEMAKSVILQNYFPWNEKSMPFNSLWTVICFSWIVKGPFFCLYHPPFQEVIPCQKKSDQQFFASRLANFTAKQGKKAPQMMNKECFSVFQLYCKSAVLRLAVSTNKKKDRN